jgi:hypothetical protein
MFSLMLDPKIKTFHLFSSFIGCQQSKVIVEEYDKKSLFPLFLKCYYHLHSLVGSSFVAKKIEYGIKRNIWSLFGRLFFIFLQRTINFFF